MKSRWKLALSISAMTALLVLAVFGASGPRAQEDPDGAEPDPIPQVSGMAYVPPGEFIMGSTFEDLHVQAEVDEYPQRRVFLDGFYIDIHEVTNIQYKVFVDSTQRKPPSHWINRTYPKGRDGYPVVGITWDDAAAYAEFVGKRLPTEEEWEKAARGTDGRRFPWGDIWDKKKANNADRLMPVMRFPEGISPYGAYDMAGNVAEWVDGWYAAYPTDEDDAPPEDSPKFKRYKPNYGNKKYRMYRGGGWNSYAKFLRCANREKAKANERWQKLGFRCAMDPPWKTESTD